jgi:hypothetical protein
MPFPSRLLARTVDADEAPPAGSPPRVMPVRAVAFPNIRAQRLETDALPG